MNKLINIFFYIFSASLFIGIAPVNISFYVLLLLFLINSLKRRENPFKNKYISYVILFYVIGILFLDFIHLDLSIFFDGVGKAIKLFLILIIIYLINDIKVLLNGIKIYIITGILSGFLSLLSYYTRWEILGRFIRIISENQVYLSGFANEHWIRYATKLSFALIFCICYLFSLFRCNKKSVFYKFIVIIGLLILNAAIFYSGSRGAALGLILGSFVLVFLKNYRLLPIILMIISIIFLFISYSTSFAVENRINNFSTDTLRRTGPWLEILKNVDEFNIGFGTGNFMAAMDYINVTDKLGCMQGHAHNNILEFLVAYGYFGVVSFLLFWLIIIIYLIKQYNQYINNTSEQYKWFFVSCFWIITTFHVIGMMEPTWVLATTSFTICFILGVLIKFFELSKIT